MKSILFLGILQLMLYNLTFGQLDSLNTDEYLISIVEKHPKYIHGTNVDLHKLISSQLNYPVEECLAGTTILSFTVNRYGKVESPKIIKSLSKNIDKQLIKLIQKYEFIPGEILGKPVNFNMCFPFRIRLE